MLTCKFEPRDLWVGVFWDRGPGWWRVYVCLVPCFPVIFGRGAKSV